MTDATVTAVYRDRIELPAIEISLASGAKVALAMDPIVVGASEDCDLVVVGDPRVSRAHCRFAFDARGITVEDLQSKNGTFVSGVEVERARIALDQSVKIGNTRIEVHIANPKRTTVPLSSDAHFGAAVGATVPMRALFARLATAANAEVTVLLLGESGTGKELLARALHDASPRRDGPFTPFDCGAVPATLIESELFGHVRGAFTGATHDRQGVLAQANGGTLFLDEIGELPLDAQSKLLRAIDARQFRPVGASEYRSFDARVVAATHRALHAEVSAGRFRQDLYYRLAVVEAKVPPLRERKDDIELLVERFLAALDPPRSIRDLPPAALGMLRSHTWPGNVRELRNVVSRLLLFPESVGEALDTAVTSSHAVGLRLDLPLREAREQIVETFERAYLVAKLAETAGNVSAAAAAMGVSRQFVHRLMERYALRRADAVR